MDATLTPRRSAQLATLAIALVGAVLLWLVVQLGWLLLAGPDVEMDPVPPLPAMAQGSRESLRFNYPLFGRSDEPAALVPTTVPSRRDNLRLRGIVSGERAYAIIADERGRESVYREDDRLADGSRIERIERTRVILERGGQRESLELRPDQASTRPAAPSSEASSQISQRPAGALFPAGSEGFNLSSLPNLGNLDSQLASQISILPVSSGGFRVRPTRDARLFAELGLQVNDIVTAVNGQPLESEEAVRTLFNDLLQGGEIAITITRQGQELVLRPDTDRLLRSLQNP